MWLSGGRRLVCCPQPALIGRDSYQGDATPALYETLEGAAADSDTPVLLWLPGAGQLPDNELLRRLANALHGVGARMVLTSAAYGDAAATLAELHTAGARCIYIGGHSRGGAEALEMSAALPRGCELAGVCTINPVPRTAAAPGTRSLTIVGEHDGGAALLGAAARSKSQSAPLGSARGRLPRLLRARLAALGSASLPGGRPGHWAPGHCLPRVLEPAASKAADLHCHPLSDPLGRPLTV